MGVKRKIKCLTLHFTCQIGFRIGGTSGRMITTLWLEFPIGKHDRWRANQNVGIQLFDFFFFFFKAIPRYPPFIFLLTTQSTSRTSVSVSLALFESKQASATSHSDGIIHVVMQSAVSIINPGQIWLCAFRKLKSRNDRHDMTNQSEFFFGGETEWKAVEMRFLCVNSFKLM